ncbi:MAG TPA: ATP-binding protein [Candidatus Kapabacteria bacterium]|nr:ATP-binding protein [Candidatus Kapabacteria bacterium]
MDAAICSFYFSIYMSTLPDKSPAPSSVGERERIGDDRNLVWLGQLTASVIHELRNPLMVISLSLSSIEDEVAKTPHLQEAFQAAKKSVERMTNIVNETLDFTRSGPGIVKLVSLKMLTQETVPLLHSAHKGKDISIEMIFPEGDSPMIQGDYHQLQRVLINLISNSIDAIPERGTINVRISSDTAAHTVTLQIEDNGSGIAENELEKIFTPFFSRKSHGTGLGLAITKTILDRHNANVKVTSKVNVGTTFTIGFPAFVS